MQDDIQSVEQAYRIYVQNMLEQPSIMSIDIQEHHGELGIKFCYSKVDETISIKNASGYCNLMTNIFDKELFPVQLRQTRGQQVGILFINNLSKIIERWW